MAATLPGRNISSDTVRRRLREYGIRARRAHRGPILTVRHRRARLDWAHRHLRLGHRYCNSVIFSDETRINLRQADWRIRVYRRPGERFSDDCVVETDRFGGGSVLIWGGICAGRKTPIVFIAGNLTAQRYRDEVLDITLLPFMNMYGPGLTFQQDNARPHTARLTRQHLQQHNVTVMNWPSRSPDLSPIEHIWDELKRNVRKNHNPQSLRELRQAVQRGWYNLPEQTVQRYVNSMRNRCLAVVRANGGHTPY